MTSRRIDGGDQGAEAPARPALEREAERIVLAVDGGNSKTELALVREDGELLAFVRGGGSSPHHLGIERAFDVLDGLFARAAGEAQVEAPVAVAQLLLAGVDFPSEVKLAVEHAANRGWAIHSTVDNDTFAVLRTGTDRGWGVAIVCGAGINCVGVAPDGRHTRFPALGAITGDWGGGQDLGIAAVAAAARSEDGRGPHTTLERAVPAHFGLASPSELAEAIHFGRIDEGRLAELAPVVLSEAADDPVAASIRDRLATEVVALARVAVDRLGLARESVDVVVGGGLFQSGDPELVRAVDAGLRVAAPHAVLQVAVAPPVLGAALLGLDELGAPASAHERLRRALAAPEEVSASSG